MIKELSPPSLEFCIPKDKHDIEAVGRAELIGFPELNPILPQLLEWTIGSTWPVAPPMGRLLSKAGPEIVPFVEEVLRSDDGTAKYHMMMVLLYDTSDFLRESLMSEIERLAYHPTKLDLTEEVDEIARDCLNNWSSTLAEKLRDET